MQSERDGVLKRLTVILMGVIVIASGAYGFTTRFMSFIHELAEEDGIAYSLVPVATYFFAAGGFFLLLLWAFLTGHLSQVEDEKFRMLDEQLALEEQDNVGGYAHG